MDSAVELHLRQLIFERLADIVAENGVVRRAELEQLQVRDQHWRVIDRNRGIRNPRELLATLSVISNPNGPYADMHVGDSRYAYDYLRHGKLLDAAHIIGDNKQHGLPIVQNGLSLCKIHHAAFDTNLLGISPDYVVRINRALMDEIDGPMLRHGLQEMDGRPLTLPARASDRPAADQLAERFDEFRAAG